jgi:hypothetical protein
VPRALRGLATAHVSDGDGPDHEDRERLQARWDPDPHLHRTRRLIRDIKIGALSKDDMEKAVTALLN